MTHSNSNRGDPSENFFLSSRGGIKVHENGKTRAKCNPFFFSWNKNGNTKGKPVIVNFIQNAIGGNC